ncbi:aryl-sulfate sulfotransferase [Mixta mediterraneensis]|uniref:aryl-sulfate sulfotransferase n=1 Tax=Mixta mediterraneensis TaxID=2758443 RepID=UPI00187610D7|nr:aryl-sulfate sulfotransferase [Mixta mediterraneensis]MBE5252866.1 aryl-sulfate sulfotransferase [Mixta mediterraneensis]
MKLTHRLSGLLLLTFCHSTLAIPTAIPVGTTFYDPARAWNGFILFPGNDNQTHLIDMTGKEVHRWKYESFPPWPIKREQLNGQRGRILVQLERQNKLDKVASPGNGMVNASVAEVNWQGDVVWQYGSQATPVHQHHELQRLDYGNTLLLGAALKRLPGYDYDVIDNTIEEITPQGKKIWSWSVADHLHEFGFSDKQLQMIRESHDPDFLHMNTAAPLGPNHWFDAGDKRFAPDNILLNSRNGNVAVIVDRRSGKVIWRIGPDYPTSQLGKPLPRPLDQMIGEHDVHMIPAGLPGADNILIFDNQGNAGYPPTRQGFFSASRVIEVNPVSKQIVWEYTGEKSQQAISTFYSAYISNAQRLPNGNTLIDEGQSGRLFQVTPQVDIVWEYVSPFYGKAMPRDHYVANTVYRAYMVPYTWAPEGTPHHETAVTSGCTHYPALPGCPALDVAK